MGEIIAAILEFFAEILTLHWWYGNSNEEHRGCFWAIVFFVLLCIVVGVVVWLVMRS